MSATQATTTQRTPGQSFRGAQIYCIVTGVAGIGAITVSALGSSGGFSDAFPELWVWASVALACDMMHVECWGGVILAMSLPITLACGMVFPPGIAAVVGVIGYVDRREFRGEISFPSAFFNRSQVGLSVLSASAAFHYVGGRLGVWPGVLGAACVAIVADFSVNLLLVSVVAALRLRTSLGTAIRRVHGDYWVTHVVAWVCLGFLGLCVAELHEGGAGSWALVVAMAPIFLAYLMFVRSKHLERTAKALNERNQALLVSIARAAEERRDERLVVAGELHDEVLPPLFKVHLMGQVLRQDLDAGRLLDLDDDLPDLLTATASAQDAIRAVVRDLRRSSLGPGGLNSTIRLLSEQLESSGSPKINLRLDDVGGSSLAHLLIYQVAREAITNAARHSHATSIDVLLRKEPGRIRLDVADDGIGFDRASVDTQAHFGLQLIAERVSAAQGNVWIDTQVGVGTRVSASIPLDIA